MNKLSYAFNESLLCRALNAHFSANPCGTQLCPCDLIIHVKKIEFPHHFYVSTAFPGPYHLFLLGLYVPLLSILLSVCFACAYWFWCVCRIKPTLYWSRGTPWSAPLNGVSPECGIAPSLCLRASCCYTFHCSIFVVVVDLCFLWSPVRIISRTKPP